MQNESQAFAGSLALPPRLAMSLVMSAVLLLAGWAALYFNRPVYPVDGVIRAVLQRTYPWNAGGRFELMLQNADGRWLRFTGLHGTCTNKARQAANCEMPEFPIGSRIRLYVSNFVDPAACPDIGRFLRDFTCLGRHINRRHTYVGAIEVDGRPVTGGWSPNLNVLALYAFVAAVSGLLAVHQWRWWRIGAGTLIAFLLMFAACAFWPLDPYF